MARTVKTLRGDVIGENWKWGNPAGRENSGSTHQAWEKAWDVEVREKC